MMDGVLDPSLLLTSLGGCLLISAGGIASVGIAYAAVSLSAGRFLRRFGSPTEARHNWLSPPTGEAYLTEAWCRAAALAVAAVGVAIAAPWVHEFVDAFVRRWDAAGDGQGSWQYGLLALTVWIGLLPFALFIWMLPERAPRRFRPSTSERSHRTIPAGSGARQPDDSLDERRPHTEPIRRACRRFASHVALCAPTAAGDGHRASLWRPPIEVALLAPAATALLLMATVNRWAVVAYIGAFAGWFIGVYLVTYGAVVSAPGVVVADYLLLARFVADRRVESAEPLAEAWLDPNPATLQDHEQLVAALRSAARIGPIPWSPQVVGASSVELTALLPTMDRAGRQDELAIAFQLRRQRGRAWRITRVALDDPGGRLTATREPHFALASVWVPR